MKSYCRRRGLPAIKHVFPKKVKKITTNEYVAKFCKLNHLICEVENA